VCSPSIGNVRIGAIFPKPQLNIIMPALATKPAKTTRAKSSGLANRIDFELAVDRVSHIQTELRTLEAERDAAVQIAQAKHAGRIKELEDEMKGKIALCEKFADEHRDELLAGKAKSAETPLSRYGFRLGNRSIVLLNKGCSWDSAVKIFKAFKLPEFVRTVEEVNKEALLQAVNADGMITKIEGTEEKIITPLATTGLKVKQVETFFVEPKVEGGETVKGGAS
jgi:phage host-nuclease inhibitor protein Gam